MKVLLIKTSSMGDVLHALPAVSDMAKAVPGLQLDWVVEEAFAEIPTWHASVRKVIPVALRRWRKNWKQAWQSGEIRRFITELKSEQYDYIIDAQGLIKSAVITRLAQGKRYGMDRTSCREPLASFAYQERTHVAKGQHAIDRIRQLCADVLGYQWQSLQLDYGLMRSRFSMDEPGEPFVLFLHGSSWQNKLWPIGSWVKLAAMLQDVGVEVLLPWGNDDELARAREIAVACENCVVLPRMNLEEIAQLLANAQGAVGVDTGLSHLCAALDVPAVILYLATSPKLTGVKGNAQVCLGGEGRGDQQNSSRNDEIEVIDPQMVWQQLEPRLDLQEDY